MPQVVGHVLCCRVPIRDVLGKSFEADAFQLPWYGVVPLPRRTDVNVPDLVQKLVHGVGLKRTPPGQELVEDHAQAENVRPPIDPMALPTSLFGTQVSRGSCNARALAE